jgi:hypothetical protein
MGEIGMKRMLDIYSGLGGASEAFRLAGWEVHRLENNVLLTHVPCTQIVDVMEWPFYDIPAGYYDFIWASPPCTDFSDGYSSPKSIAKREKKQYDPDMTLVLKAKEIIDFLKPEHYVIENVRGSRPYITKALQMPPRQIVQSFYFWGKFPFIHVDADWRHSKYDNEPWSTDPLRANYRAKIPLEISKAFHDELTCQTTLEDWS